AWRPARIPSVRDRARTRLPRRRRPATLSAVSCCAGASPPTARQARYAVRHPSHTLDRRGGAALPFLVAEPVHDLLGLVRPVLDQEVGHRSEEHTSELQSRENLVCRLLLEKKKNKKQI